MTLTLSDLGWSNFFLRQSDPDGETVPLRLTHIHRDRVEAIGPEGAESLTVTAPLDTGDLAVGDWVAVDPECRVMHLYDRQTLLSRRAAGTDARVQLIAANVDTLLIVSSCNADFNPARLERYMALARGAGSYPVVVLTKADLCNDPDSYRRKAEALAPMLSVLCVNAHDATEIAQIAGWIGRGQTGALVGSSGVGKTTLLNGLTGGAAATQGIREDDAKGRHTTTARSLRRVTGGGWIIDTPGMRALRLQDSAEGIGDVFAEITELAEDCRFSDCQHDTEPGCAVQRAIAAGGLDPERLTRWRKLLREDARNSESVAQARARDRAFGKMVKSEMAKRDRDKRS